MNYDSLQILYDKIASIRDDQFYMPTFFGGAGVSADICACLGGWAIVLSQPNRRVGPLGVRDFERACDWLGVSTSQFLYLAHGAWSPRAQLHEITRTDALIVLKLWLIARNFDQCAELALEQILARKVQEALRQVTRRETEPRIRPTVQEYA
jgi:hypothetical protein